MAFHHVRRNMGAEVVTSRERYGPPQFRAALKPCGLPDQMALWSHASPRIVDAMETALIQRPTNPLKDKVIHADIQIQSIENVPKREQDVSENSRLTEESEAPEDDGYKKRAAEMQMWWEDAIAKNMDVPDGYLKVAVLLIKWADELDELNTKDEAEELEAVFRERFHFRTKTVELNVAKKPQHQMRKHLSDFVEEYDGPNSLLIVYYTGHGRYREDERFLELTARLNPMDKKGLFKEARCNWNKAEEILRSDDVESDILTILDTCYSSNLAKSSKDETRTYELLSACAIDQTTAAPGDHSFTRALIDALKELLDQFGDRPFSTFRLNQRILLDKRRHDTPSVLWVRMQHNEQHIRLAPLKPDQDRQRQSPGFHHPARGYLTLRFALRDEALNQEQIQYLTMNLTRAFHKKAMVGLRRIDWLGIKPARTTHFGRAALALYAIAQWKKVVLKRREEKAADKQAQKSVNNIRMPADMAVTESIECSLTRKRTRDSFDDFSQPEPKREYLVVEQPPSPPVSDSSRVEDPRPEALVG